MADQIVAPGEQIRPMVTLDGAVTLAEELFGLRVAQARELDGYDDKNYHLMVTDPPDNKYITSIWKDGYVLKIMNSSDSKKLDCVEAQCKMMIHLEMHGIKTPQPQKNKDGKLFCVKTLPMDKNKSGQAKEHVVRLLTYVEGTMLKDIPWSYKLNHEVGIYAARLDLVLQSYSHPAYEHYSSLWMLKNVSNIKRYLFVFEENDNRIQLVNDVVKCFEDQVLSRYDTLKSGMIHGDIHDQNLLCEQDGDEWHIGAVLDLGDSHHSAYVMELALATAYMILQSCQVRSGTHVVAGYCSVHPLPMDQLKLLKVCVCARLCQSLVLGLYTHSLYPTNDYVLTTQPRGWELLNQIWTTDSAILEQEWFSLLPQEYYSS